jgi:hypothetical protein
MHRGTAPAISAGRLKTDNQGEDNRSEDDRTEADHQAGDDVSRLAALISIGKYAAYVTPATTVLVRGDAALAYYPCNPGGGTGDGPGGGPGAGPPHSCV